MQEEKFERLPDGTLFLQLGNTKCYIIEPDITREESQRRWEEAMKVWGAILLS